MSNYNSLKTTINANIKQNGNQEITGQILNSVLNQMVTTLGAGYQFAGVATTATNPGSPDAKVFYIANGKGTYTNFGGLQVTEDDVVVLYWDSSWHKVSTGIASQEKLSELEGKIFSTEFTFKANGNLFAYPLVSGNTYVFTNNSNAACLLGTSSGNFNIKNGLDAHKSFSWTATADYPNIYVYGGAAGVLVVEDTTSLSRRLGDVESETARIDGDVEQIGELAKGTSAKLGRIIKQPTESRSGYLYADGTYANDSNYHHILVDVADFVGERITSQAAQQYGFLSEYNVPNKSVFVGERTTGKPENVLIPQGAKYLYIYTHTSTYLPIITTTADKGVIGEVEKLNESVDTINTTIYGELNPYFPTLENLWFDSSGGIYAGAGNGFTIPVKANDSVVCDVKSSTAYYLWLGSDKKKVSGQARTTINGRSTIVAPVGASYLWVANEYTLQGTKYAYNSIVVNEGTNVFQRYITRGLVSSELPKCVVSYTASQKTFKVYQNFVGTDRYLMLLVSLKNNTGDVAYQYLWSMTDGGYYTYDGSVFTPILDNIINQAENEFTFKLSNSRDFTGGFHGDERIDIDTEKCYVKFLIDGYEVTDLASDFVRECRTFSYIQMSTLHNTTAEGQPTDHTIIAYHLKQNDFVDCGCKVRNVVKFVRNVNISTYFTALFCMKKKVGETFEVGGTIVTADDSVDASFTNFLDTKASNIKYWNNANKVGAEIDSKLVRGGTEPDNINYVAVWSRGGTQTDKDNKLYRYTNLTSKASGDIVETRMEVKFY
ncbi:MAG: hypothetical protein MJZ12_00355 [Prevotella sp.]|nr:hypothetical protein [Prevotella sp.]